MQILTWPDLIHLSPSDYQKFASDFITEICTIKPFTINVDRTDISVNLETEFAASSHTYEPFTLRTHSQIVMQRCYEQWSHYHIDQEIECIDMTLHLALHDIGKNLAVNFAGHKVHQHRFTVEIVKHVLTHYQKAELIPLLTSLVNMDPLGSFLKGKRSLDDTISMIKDAAQLSNTPETQFFRILHFYYICDASAYKSLLERIFRYSDEGKLHVHPEKERKDDFMKLMSVFR